MITKAGPRKFQEKPRSSVFEVLIECFTERAIGRLAVIPTWYNSTKCRWAQGQLSGCSKSASQMLWRSLGRKAITRSWANSTFSLKYHALRDTILSVPELKRIWNNRQQHSQQLFTLCQQKWSSDKKKRMKWHLVIFSPKQYMPEAWAAMESSHVETLRSSQITPSLYSSKDRRDGKTVKMFACSSVTVKYWIRKFAYLQIHRSNCEGKVLPYKIASSLKMQSFLHCYTPCL